MSYCVERSMCLGSFNLTRNWEGKKICNPSPEWSVSYVYNTEFINTAKNADVKMYE